jgi:HTH-type transcriptional regulator / antitoxin HigA
LQHAIDKYDAREAEKKSNSGILAKAGFEALKSEYEALDEQIREYENLRSGTVKVLKANSIGELPKILIQARIALGWSQKQLADVLNLKEQQIQRYESEEYGSASLKRLSEIADALNLNISEVAEFKPIHSDLVKEPGATDYLEWSKFPVKEMYRRGWFEGFKGSLSAAMSDAEELTKDFFGSLKLSPSIALHHKKVRSGSSIDLYSLFAWECRILFIAKNSPELPSFKLQSIDNDWISELTKQSRFEDGPLRAKQFLGSIGIHLAVEPHLPNTHLDGAAMLFRDNAVIGLTLRYDRLDNFWFVLLHELAHIKYHLRKGKVENIFDDLDSEADDLEKEADDFALESLIPSSFWDTALPRYLRTETSVESFARERSVHPAIIAGRIRHEAKNYIILNSLIGHGEVRKHFSDVKFGL